MKNILFIVFAFSLAINNWSQSNQNKKDVTDVSLTEKKKIKKLDEKIFKNLKSHSKAEGLKITWSLDYDLLNQVKDKKIVIKYNTKIGAKRSKKGYEGSEWKFSKPIDINKTSFEIKDLQGSEKYVIYLGIVDGDIKNIAKSVLTLNF